MDKIILLNVLANLPQEKFEMYPKVLKSKIPLSAATTTTISLPYWCCVAIDKRTAIGARGAAVHI